VLPVLAVLATLWGVYYSRQQLNEAKRIREENQKFFEDQRREDNVWSEKCVYVSQMLCTVAPRFIQGSANRPGADALGILFPDPSLRTRVLSHLIEQKSGLVYIARPLDTNQLRLRPMRELIDLVLKKIRGIQGYGCRHRQEDGSRLNDESS
jgi:hypothetical protein